MKKSLLALAALSAFATAAQAQSSVTVFGNLDMSYGTVTDKSTAANGTVTTNKTKNTGNGDGALSTSEFGVKGTEDLGGGLSANFYLAYDLVDVGVGANGNTSSGTAADAATTTNAADKGLGARFSWISLSDKKMGELRLGRQAQLIHGTVAGGSAGGANNVAGAVYSAGMAAFENGASVRPHNVYLNRAITYLSPSINGVTVGLQTSNQTWDEGTTQTYAKETGASLNYAVGKLTLSAATAVNKLEASADEKTTMTAYNATYDFGVAKVFALHTKRKVQDVDAGELDADTKNTEIGVRVPVGKTTFWASAFDGSRKGLSTSDLTVGNADTKGYQLGVSYSLSKRTTAYAIVGEQEIKGAGATDNDLKLDTKQMALGLRHAF
jgi:predicted porin